MNDRSTQDERREEKHRHVRFHVDNADQMGEEIDREKTDHSDGHEAGDIAGQTNDQYVNGEIRCDQDIDAFTEELLVNRIRFEECSVIQHLQVLNGFFH